jgi:hypothetical protein
MKLKLFILFLLVFGAIGQTIFLNIDAKSNFLQENSENSHTNLSDSELNKSSVQPSEVVVTIRQHESETMNHNVSSDTEPTTISIPLKTKKPCSQHFQQTKEERLICQKAKDAAKQKQNQVSGSNHTKNSTIQNP